MTTKKYLSLTRLEEYDDLIKSYIDAGDANKADTSALTSHTGDDTVHITSAERTDWNAAKSHADAPHAPVGAQANVIESIKVNGTVKSIENKTVDITVPTDNKDLTNGAGYLVAADIANKADKNTTLSGYGITDAYTKGEVDSALNGKSDSNHNHDDKYDELGAASTAESNANAYTDEKIAGLLDNSTDAVDSIMELADAMKDNADAIEALEGIAAGKANATHSHAISDVTNLQTTLDAKAAASDLTSHTDDEDIHVTKAKKSNWDAAYTHSQASHAPVDAQANVIETIKVNGSDLSVTGKAVNITVPTDYLVADDIANKADKNTTLAGYGITDAYTKTEVNTELGKKADQSSLDAVSSVADKAKADAATNTQAISANTSAISGHTTRIGNLESLVGDGFEEITTAEIQALFA